MFQIRQGRAAQGLIAALALVGCGGAPAAGPPALILERSIPLKGVAGRIDHLAVDLEGRRLFVAELGNGTVDALDLDGGGSVRLSGLSEPQGLAYLPASKELAVASGDGTVRFFGGAPLAEVARLKVGEDADNLRVDRAGRLVVGYGDGALAVIDPAAHRVIREIRLSAHPESFRLDGDRVFVNLPDSRSIAVGDLSAGRVTATWKAGHAFNYPMAFNPAGGVLAIVYRLPSRLVLLDPSSGAVRSDVATCGDADDVFFDDRRRRIYVTCGSGAVDVLDAAAADLRRLQRIDTRSGARTGLFVPELDRLFVAARAQGAQAATILVFKPQP